MFADELDMASHLAQKHLELSVAAALAQRPQPLLAISICHNCDEPLEEGLRFCDDLCRDDYEHRQARRRING